MAATQVSNQPSVTKQEQRLRMLELERLAAFGRFSAGLIHEVANPLTAASLNLAALPKTSRAVVEARKSLRYLQRYLIAARKQLQGQTELTSFSVRSEIGQVVRILKLRAQLADVRLTTVIEGSPKLYGDPIKFSQLVANLLVNAIEAYGRSGSHRDQLVSLQVTPQATGITVIVTDNGRGIPLATMPKIFEPFFSTKRGSKAGMGIGLALVKQYVEEDFHGAIKVSSTVERGTSFIVSLESQ